MEAGTLQITDAAPRGITDLLRSDMNAVFTDRRSWLLICAALIFIAFFIIFYPPFFEGDSRHYIAQAELLKQGKMFEQDPYFSYYLNPYPANGKYFAIYPVGEALWILPFLILGSNYIYLSGLLMHLIGWVAFILVLRRLNLNPLYSLFYLFFPPLVYYSRTLYSEPLTITLLLLGLYFYLARMGKSDYVAGILWGLMQWVRVPIIAYVLPFLILRVLEDRQRGLRMLATFAVVAGLIIPFNLFFFGAIIPYYLAGNASHIGVSNFSGGLLFNYFIAVIAGFSPGLNMEYFVFPLLLLGAAFLRKEMRVAAFGSLGLSIGLFTFYGAPYARYILPALVLLLPGYAFLVEKAVSSFKLPRAAFAVLFILNLVCISVITSTSQANLSQLWKASEKLYAQTVENSLIIGTTDAQILLFRESGKRYFAGIENLSSPDFHSIVSKFPQAYIVDVNTSRPALGDLISRLLGSRIDITVRKYDSK